MRFCWNSVIWLNGPMCCRREQKSDLQESQVIKSVFYFQSFIWILSFSAICNLYWRVIRFQQIENFILVFLVFFFWGRRILFKNETLIEFNKFFSICLRKVLLQGINWLNAISQKILYPIINLLDRLHWEKTSDIEYHLGPFAAWQDVFFEYANTTSLTKLECHR